MALYKNGNALQHSNHQAFDAELGPGTQAPNPESTGALTVEMKSG